MSYVQETQKDYEVLWSGSLKLDWITYGMLGYSLLNHIITVALLIRASCILHTTRGSIYLQGAVAMILFVISFLCAGHASYSEETCLAMGGLILFSVMACLACPLMDSLYTVIQCVKSKNMHFGFYCLASWGLPCLVVIIYISTHYTQRKLFTGLGCWLHEQESFYGPVGTLFAVHIILHSAGLILGHRIAIKESKITRRWWRSSMLNGLFVSLPIYGLVFTLFFLLNGYPLVVEYIFSAICAIQSFLMLCMYLLADPMVRFILSNNSRKKEKNPSIIQVQPAESIQPNPPPKPKFAYIP